MEKLAELKEFVITKLRSELNPQLTYHNVEHTLNVFSATQMLCEGEKLNKKTTYLMLAAALFHDSGFLINRENHEELSCELAKKHLPEFDFSYSEIEKICSVIMATKTGHTPQNNLEKIIKDADLDYLGTDIYEEISNRLFTELRNFNLISEDTESWNKLQINFLKAHKYYTVTANRLRDLVKQKTLSALLEKID